MAVSGYRRFRLGRDNCLAGPVLTSYVVLSGGVHKASCPWRDNAIWSDDWQINPVNIEQAVTHLQELGDLRICKCGFSACKALDHLSRQVNGDWGAMFKSDVTAAVTMWGTLVEYEHGYRAEYMQIDHLWLDGPTSHAKEIQAAALTARYGVGCDIGTFVKKGEYVWSESGCQVLFGKGGNTL